MEPTDKRKPLPQYIPGKAIDMPDYTVMWSGVFINSVTTLQLSIPNIPPRCECGVDHLAEDGMQSVNYVVFDEEDIRCSGILLLQLPAIDTFNTNKEEIFAAIKEHYRRRQEDIQREVFMMPTHSTVQ